MEEIWKDIPNFEGYYQMSNLCRVRSVDRYVMHYPDGFALRKGKIIQQHINKNTGYTSVTLKKEGKQTNKLIHRLMYETFIGEIPEGMQVNHIDEDKTNNKLSNLNLMSPKDNINWGTGMERMIKNRTGCKAPIPVFQYGLEGDLIKEWCSAREVERELGFSQGNISLCCLGKRKTCGGYIWKY